MDIVECDYSLSLVIVLAYYAWLRGGMHLWA